jgi:hypothetical protein
MIESNLDVGIMEKGQVGVSPDGQSVRVKSVVCAPIVLA